MPITRRDHCHLLAQRAALLKPDQACIAWGALAGKIDDLAEMDIPKFKNLILAIEAAATEGKATQPTERRKVEVIQDLICRRFQIPVVTLLSRSRRGHLIWPRMLVLSFAYEFTDLTQKQIVALLGMSKGDNHSMVCYAADYVTNRAQTEPKARAQRNELRAELQTIFNHRDTENTEKL